MKRILLLTAAMLGTLAASAELTVTGTVYEPDGDTAVGVSVHEKGRHMHGTVTDLAGEFVLEVSSPEAELVISYVGTETQSLKLDGRTDIVVHLVPSTTALNDIVVVGYGHKSKLNATGAVKTIGADLVQSRAVGNAVQALQGAVAGLNISTDRGGVPGSSMEINIRGVGSIGDGSSASPLVLIDGMEGDLSSVNPADIESISVLKDAATASIYGSRAPFGVLLVTTRTGAPGTKVDYSGNVRFMTPTRVPRRVDSYTMALMANDGYSNSGRTPFFTQDKLERLLQYQQGLIKDAVAPDNPTKWGENFTSWANTDWYDVYMKKCSFAQEHNASVSGGTEKVKYYFSGNYMGQGGMFNYADEKYERLALTGKVNVRFNRYVKFSWSSRLVSTLNDKPSALNALFYHNLGRRYATEPLYLPNGDYHPKSLVPAVVDGGRERSRSRRFYNQANLIIEPLTGWMLHAEVNSLIESNPYTRQYAPVSVTGPNGDPIYVQVLEAIGTRHDILPDGTFNVSPAPGESYYEKAQANVNYFSTNFYTDYIWTPTSEMGIKFLAGVQTEYYSHDVLRAASSNIAIADKPFFPSETGGSTTMSSESRGEWSSVGIFGRIYYNYDNRYMAEVNFRADGASRFPRNQRWGYFPAFSTGWNIANERFWAPLSPVCNYLKIRGSYGKLGNQNTTSFYPFYQQMSTTGGQVIIGGNQATILPVYAPFSTSLTWEKIETAGVGLDFGFFNSRLMGSFDWYQRTTKDMVGPSLQLPGVYGGDAPKTNNAELRTRGWEAELSWRDHVGKDFSYTVSASVSDYKTKVTRYDSATGDIYGWYAGKDYGEIWGYEVVGLARTDEEMTAYLASHPQTSIGENWGAGDIMYRNLDSNPAINAGASTVEDHGDLKVIGNSTPRFAYSFNLEGRWRFIDIRAFFQGVGKRDYFIGNSGSGIGTSTFFGFGGGPWQFTPFVDHLDYFRPEGSPLGANIDAYYGRLRTDRNNIQYCDRFVQNASYLRLKNLTIGFSLPAQAGLSRYVRKARLYFSAENVFTMTKLRIFDPEALVSSDEIYDGGAGKSYPQFRTFSVGLELTF